MWKDSQLQEHDTFNLKQYFYYAKYKRIYFYPRRLPYINKKKVNRKKKSQA